MGGNVADYKYLRDSPFELGAYEDHYSQTFTLPGGLGEGEESILSFMLLRTEDVRLTIEINGNSVVDRGYRSSNVERCIQELCPKDILKQENNNIVFSISQGECKISDVVLWFQRKG